jgi:hypothetical protein
MGTIARYLCAQLFCGGLLCLFGETSQAILKVQVMTFIGDTLDEASISLLEKNTNDTIKCQVTNNGTGYTLQPVPYGSYILQVRRPGFREHKQLLTVYQPRLSFRVFMRLARISDEKQTELIGSVVPAPGAATRLWIKLLPLLSTELIGETEVNAKGEFSLTGLDEGRYVLVVMKDTDVLHMTEIKLFGSPQLKIELPKYKP